MFRKRNTKKKNRQTAAETRRKKWRKYKGVDEKKKGKSREAAGTRGKTQSPKPPLKESSRHYNTSPRSTPKQKKGRWPGGSHLMQPGEVVFCRRRVRKNKKEANPKAV